MGYVDALIVGLGNPGSKYARTRHNIGWMAVDALLAEQGAKTKDKYNGRYAEVRLGEVAVGVLAPETFMNDSGRSVGACVHDLKLPLDEKVGRLVSKACSVHNGGKKTIDETVMTHIL